MYKSYRRSLFLVTLLMVGVASGQVSFETGEFRPYDEISVKGDELESSLERRVFFFAHFTCTYCRQAHNYMEDWGDQLPSPYEFEVVPAIGLGEHIPMAVAYYVVLQLRPEQLRSYENALYSELQDRGGNPIGARSYQAAAQKIGITETEFNAAAKSEATRGYVERAYELTTRYSVQEVPTVVLANRFRTGPGRVYNEQHAFVSLLNGLISMDYQERYKR